MIQALQAWAFACSSPGFAWGYSHSKPSALQRQKNAGVRGFCPDPEGIKYE
jgi:hypothetical protein